MQFKLLHFEGAAEKREKMLRYIPDPNDIDIVIIANRTLQGNICLIPNKEKLNALCGISFLQAKDR